MNRLLIGTALLMAGACSGGEPRLQEIDSSIRAPTRPGEPYSLVRSGWNQIHEIAISDNYLSFATAWTGVLQIPKFGGGLSLLDAGGDKTDYEGVAATANTVVWGRTSFGGRDKFYTHIKVETGTDASSTVISEGPFGLVRGSHEQQFVVAGDFLYFLMNPSHGDIANVVRIPLAGGELTPVLTGDAEWSWPNWTADRTGVYFIPRQHPTTAPSELYSMPDGGGIKTLLAEISGEECDIVASDDAYVYVTRWLNEAYNLVRVSKVDGAQKVLLEGTFFDPWTAVSDGQFIYTRSYIKGEDAKIIAIPKEGGAPIEIGSDRRFYGIDQMIVDQGNLYMLSNYEEILLLPKKTPGMQAPK